MIHAVRQRLTDRSAAMLLTLEGRLSQLMTAWLLLVVAACGLRVATSPLEGAPGAETLLSYLALAAAPIASMLVALRWFGKVPGEAPSSDRGWNHVGLVAARRHPLYGPGGLMVALLVGMLINVPVRAAEYFAALPALSGHVPAWLATLHLAMTADVVLFTSLYAVAFVAALRRAPLFPKLLCAIWAADLVMQVGVASAVAKQGDLPPAVGAALHQLLDGNVLKVLVSIALWLPYLILSTRVNITYRHRLPI
jgi:hypothetical protein